MPHRRSPVVAVGVAVVLLFTSCDRGGPGDEAGEAGVDGPSSTTSSSSTTSTAPDDVGPCDLGAVPPAGEITVVRAGRLLGVAPEPGAEARCLADQATATPQWNGSGDRLVLDASVVLSRPTGKSLLRIVDGRLHKQPVGGGEEVDVSFLDATDSAVYHPKGEHIAAVGRRAGQYGIFVATNTGQGARLVTAGEFATTIDQLAWTASGALVFVADHDGARHLHRLAFPALDLTTVAEATGQITAVAASRFDGAGLAWTESSTGGCALRVNRGGKVVTIPPGPATAWRPVGWLPGGVLVAREGCNGTDVRILTIDLSGDVPTVAVVTDGAGDVAVRAALPVGPGLDLDAVVESQAPA